MKRLDENNYIYATMKKECYNSSRQTDNKPTRVKGWFGLNHPFFNEKKAVEGLILPLKAHYSTYPHRAICI
jgi:hypothetical protein